MHRFITANAFPKAFKVSDYLIFPVTTTQDYTRLHLSKMIGTKVLVDEEEYIMVGYDAPAVGIHILKKPFGLALAVRKE